MGDKRLLASGDVLAGRYVLEDLVSEKLGASTWRANDRLLARNVGIEVLPSSDPRSEQFLAAARDSTKVTDPRFLRVLDLMDDDHGHHLVVREWARAFPLDQLLAQSPLPNRRAATVVAEVAEAMSHAHEVGLHHRRLTPHQVLLKQSGAVRVVGLGVAQALAPVGSLDPADHAASEQMDVQALGRLLYACLTSRWPGGQIDGLRAAPTEHGRLLRPRQVKAGVSRDVDTVCDRVLGRPPRHHETPLRAAADIAASLHMAGVDDVLDDQPSLVGRHSPDLLRLDPVVRPAGPPPGLEPPRRRPRSMQPAPPTTFERGKDRARRMTKGDRLLVLAGIVGAMVLAGVLSFLVGRASNDEPAPRAASDQPVRALPITSVKAFDPQSPDGRENDADARLAVDRDLATGWRTSTYFNRPDLGGLKNGVGLLVDLGGVREVASVRVRLAGEPTDFNVLAARPDATVPPSRVRGTLRVSQVPDAGLDTAVQLPDVRTRWLVVWLTSLPRVDGGDYRGEIREITVRGRA